MVGRLLLVAVALFAVGCHAHPDNNEFVQLQANPPSTVQVDGVDVQAPGTVELSTDENHVVVWPDGTQSLIETTNNGSSPLEYFLRSFFGSLSPKYLEWEEGQGVVSGG